MGRSSAEYGEWFATTGFAYLIGNLFCVRFAPRHSIEKLIWFGLALQLAGALLNLLWGIAGLNQLPSWLFGTQMLLMVGNAFETSSTRPPAPSACARRPPARHRGRWDSCNGLGSLFSRFGACSALAISQPR